MAQLVCAAGPLFSQAERSFLELMVDTLARASSFDPVGDFFLPHRDVPELGNDMKRQDIFELDLQQGDSASIVVDLPALRTHRINSDTTPSQPIASNFTSRSTMIAD